MNPNNYFNMQDVHILFQIQKHTKENRKEKCKLRFTKYVFDKNGYR